MTPQIVPDIVKSFAELSWQVVALDTIDNRDVSLQLLTASPPGTSSGTATPLEQAMQRSRDLLAQLGPWHHGGINE
ncbi:MAG: hypothetical protein ABSD29_08185 [Verrucomicrobiota bacterium]|jgi:hypothetical protein